MFSGPGWLSTNKHDEALKSKRFKLGDIITDVPAFRHMGPTYTNEQNQRAYLAELKDKAKTMDLQRGNRPWTG